MEQPEITFDEHQFRITVVKSLTRLETLAESTDGHLKRLNGSVARHEERIATLQQNLTEHPLECPMRQEVDSLKASVITEQAEEKATAAWWSRVSPLVWLVIGGVLALFLLHSPDLLKLFTKP